MWVSELHAARRAARRRSLLHPLAAGRHQQPRARQLPIAHRRHPGRARRVSARGSPTASAPRTRICPATCCSSTPARSAARRITRTDFCRAAFQATRLRDKGTPVLDLLPPDEFAAGQRASLDLIRESESAASRDARRRSPNSTPASRATNSPTGCRAPRSKSARSIENHQRCRASYGLEHEDKRTRAFGRKCLLARRLVERGVRFVQLYDMPDKDGWDAHDKIYRQSHSARALDRSAHRRAARRI